MTFSFPLVEIWDKTAPIPVELASVSRTNVASLPGNDRTEAVQSVSFIVSNASSVVAFYFTAFRLVLLPSLSRILSKGFIFSE